MSYSQVPQTEYYEQQATKYGNEGRLAEIKKNVWKVRGTVILASVGIFCTSVVLLGIVTMFIKLVVYTITS